MSRHERPRMHDERAPGVRSGRRNGLAVPIEAAPETIRRADATHPVVPEDDHRRHMPRFQGENFERNLRLVAAVEELAAAKEVTPAQLAIAWVLRQGDDIVPIPGTTTVRHLEDNAAALHIELTREELDRLDEIAPPGAATGDRYPNMSTVNR